MNKIGVLDIETTGLASKRDCIVEIGICELNLIDGCITKLFDKIIKEDDFYPNKYKNAWIFENSDLKIEDIMKAKSLNYYRPILNHIFNKYYITAFNSSFDFKFLEQKSFKIKKLKDPMHFATQILKLAPTEKMKSSPRHMNRFKTPNVEEAWNNLIPESPYTEKHRGYDDAIHEAKIIYSLYKDYGWRIYKYEE